MQDPESVLFLFNLAVMEWSFKTVVAPMELCK